MLRKLFALFAASSLAPAQMPEPAAPEVVVPVFPNSTCPIMGKKVSLPLFVDTDLGRIYVCCKPCIRKVLADVPTAHKTAYPAVQEVANEVCPVSGEAIGAQRESIVLQGFRFALCCAGCLAPARAEAQVVLARLHRPALVDVGNGKCPVDGQPVQPNVFAVVGDAIVRLSSLDHLDEVQKAPQAMLDAARAIAFRQERPAPHRHTGHDSASPAQGGKVER